MDFLRTPDSLKRPKIDIKKEQKGNRMKGPRKTNEVTLRVVIRRDVIKLLPLNGQSSNYIQECFCGQSNV